MTKKEIKKEYIDMLTNRYSFNNELKLFDIVHMYKTKIAYPNGFHDSMFFDAILFNTKTNEKRKIEGRDSIDFSSDAQIKMIRIFIDGSTIVCLKGMHKIDIFQALQIYKLTRD